MRDGVVTEGCSVEFALTEDDLVAFASLPFARTPLLRLSVDFYRILVFVGTVAILLVAYAIFGDGRWWYDPQFRGSVIGYGFLAMVALVFLDRPLGVMLLRRRIRSGCYADFMRHRRVDVSLAGVSSLSTGEEVTIPWSSLARVGVTEAGALLVGEELVLAVPRRAFADQAAFVFFVRTAQTQHRAATS
jgi:hypothetical protein